MEITILMWVQSQQKGGLLKIWVNVTVGKSKIYHLPACLQFAFQFDLYSIFSQILIGGLCKQIVLKQFLTGIASFQSVVSTGDHSITVSKKLNIGPHGLSKDFRYLFCLEEDLVASSNIFGLPFGCG